MPLLAKRDLHFEKQMNYRKHEETSQTTSVNKFVYTIHNFLIHGS